MALIEYTFSLLRVERRGQKVYPESMKLLRTALFCWFSLGLMASGWAQPSACVPDEFGSEPSLHDGHQHHGHGAAAAHDHHSPAQLPPHAGTDSSGSCECCDVCATACSASVAAMVQADELPAWLSSRHRPRIGTVGLHSDPQGHPPFRPPISAS